MRRLVVIPMTEDEIVFGLRWFFPTPSGLAHQSFYHGVLSNPSKIDQNGITAELRKDSYLKIFFPFKQTPSLKSEEPILVDDDDFSVLDDVIDFEEI